jgi:DNA-binding CsgD family transcriptional regulator
VVLIAGFMDLLDVTIVNVGAGGDHCRGGGDGPGLRAGAAGTDPAELEVLRPVAAGRGNREIAGELFISAKTASVHVSNILGKLGVTGRAKPPLSPTGSACSTPSRSRTGTHPRRVGRAWPSLRSEVNDGDTPVQGISEQIPWVARW